MSRAGQIFHRYQYPLTSRYFSSNDTVFFNWGYEEDPPMALPLAASDEPNRYFIQLYHRTATQVDLTGKRVLEVSCGHGGGASYLMRTLGPASYTGLDLNRVGVDFCRKKHQIPNLDFVQGNAEKLPFADQSFDVVINIEASHCYAEFPRFLAEVSRVLCPQGHFLYADFRRPGKVAKWEDELGNAPTRLMAERVINEEVARGLEHIFPVVLFKMQPRLLASFYFTVFAYVYRELQNKAIIYRMHCYANE